MLISKQNLAIIPATVNSDSQYNLSNLKIDPVSSTLTATNGASVYLSNLPTYLPAEDFPYVASTNEILPTECVMVPAKSLEKAGKNLPKKSSLPILQNILLTQDNTFVHLHTTDLEDYNDVKFKQKEWQEFPDVQALIDTQAKIETTGKTCLSLKELQLMCKVMKAHGAEAITIEISNSSSHDYSKYTNNPVKVTADMPGLTGYIMPYDED